MSDFFYNLGIADAFTWLAERLGGADLWQQALLLMLAGAVPFIESYLGSFLGVLLGVPAGVAIPAAIAGNLLATLGIVQLTSKARTAVTAGRTAASTPDSLPEAKESRARRRIRANLERWGVPGVSLIGPLVLASQITAPALVALGASRRSVLIWQAVAIIAWGLAFGFFGEVLIERFGWGA